MLPYEQYINKKQNVTKYIIGLDFKASNSKNYKIKTI